MHADRIDVFHVTYSDAVTCTVTHHLILDLFPAGDTALYEHLSHTGETQTVLQDFHELVGIMSDTTAASSQCVCRTEHHRITDLIGKCKTIIHALHNKRSRNRFTDLLHCRLEFKTVLRLFDRL